MYLTEIYRIFYQSPTNTHSTHQSRTGSLKKINKINRTVTQLIKRKRRPKLKELEMNKDRHQRNSEYYKAKIYTLVA